MRKENKILPKFFVIETSSFCNLQCSICPHKNMSETRKGIMSIELFEKIIKNIKEYAEGIQLYWMGEPFLNKKLIHMIKFAKKLTSAKLIVSTNGLMLNEKLIEEVVNSGLDELIISVDATRENTYQKIRVGGNLKILESNIIKVLEYKKKMNSKIKINLQFIKMHLNNDEISEFKKKWEKYDCEISYSCLYSWSNQMPMLNSMSNYLSPVSNTERRPCLDLWNKMCIRFDGLVSLCCFDYNNTVCLGDLAVESVEEIWNNEKITKIRNEHTTGIYKRICLLCDSWAIEEEYENLKK